MTVKVSVKGGSKLSQRLRRLRGAVDKAAVHAVGQAADELRVEASLAARRVTRGDSGDAESLERAGDRLSDSVFADVDFDRPSARVGTDHEFGRDLEFGTTELDARPWLFPTFERLKPKLREQIAKAVKKAVTSASRG